MTERALTTIDDLVFNDRGLIPAITQDTGGHVVMFGWMKAESVRETLETGRMTYWSRSRDERWVKGESSGGLQLVKEAFYDCDGDVLLFIVDQQGSGACVTGNYSCFYRDLRDLVAGS